VILFNAVVEIFDLADLNVGVIAGVVIDDRCCVGTALTIAKTTTETAYYVLSTALCSERFNAVVRSR
jgi:hypothetical protein